MWSIEPIRFHSLQIRSRGKARQSVHTSPQNCVCVCACVPYLKVVLSGTAAATGRSGRRWYRLRWAPRAPGGCEDFQTLGTWRWQWCQPYAPTAFTPKGRILVLLSVRGRVGLRTRVQRDGSSMKNLKDPIGNWTRDLSACSVVVDGRLGCNVNTGRKELD